MQVVTRKLARRGAGWSVALTLWALLPLVSSHICDGQTPGTYLCDPDTQGSTYYICMGPSTGHPHYHMSCKPPLLFNNAKSTCDWPRNVPICNPPQQTPATVTPTPPVTPAPPVPPNPCAGLHGDLICEPTTGGRTFLQCAWGVGHSKACGQGTLFNPQIKVCDWPQNIKTHCP